MLFYPLIINYFYLKLIIIKIFLYNRYTRFVNKMLNCVFFYNCSLDKTTCIYFCFVNLAPVVFVVLRVKVNGKNGIGVHGNPTG